MDLIYWSVVVADVQIASVTCHAQETEGTQDKGEPYEIVLTDVSFRQEQYGVAVVGRYEGKLILVDPYTETAYEGRPGMICENCKEIIPIVEGGKFCSSCGNPLPQEEAK